MDARACWRVAVKENLTVEQTPVFACQFDADASITALLQLLTQLYASSRT